MAGTAGGCSTSSSVGGSSSPMTSGTWEACWSPSESWEPRTPDPELDVLHGIKSRSVQPANMERSCCDVVFAVPDVMCRACAAQECATCMLSTRQLQERTGMLGKVTLKEVSVFWSDC